MMLDLVDWKRIVASTSPAVSLDDVKLHLAISDGTHDAFLLQQTIPSAEEMLSLRLNRALLTSTWEITYPDFGCGQLRLPCGQFQSMIGVEYDSADEEGILIDDDAVYLRGPCDYKWITPVTSWPSDAVEVRVQWVCGYTQVTLPRLIRQGLLLLAGHFFENRDPVLVGSISKPMEHSLDAIYIACALHDDFMEYRP